MMINSVSARTVARWQAVNAIKVGDEIKRILKSKLNNRPTGGFVLFGGHCVIVKGVFGVAIADVYCARMARFGTAVKGFCAQL